MMLAEMNVNEHTYGTAAICQFRKQTEDNSAPRGISTVGSAPPCQLYALRIYHNLVSELACHASYAGSNPAIRF